MPKVQSHDPNPYNPPRIQVCEFLWNHAGTGTVSTSKMDCSAHCGRICNITVGTRTRANTATRTGRTIVCGVPGLDFSLHAKLLSNYRTIILFPLSLHRLLSSLLRLGYQHHSSLCTPISKLCDGLITVHSVSRGHLCLNVIRKEHCKSDGKNKPVTG